MPSNERAVDSVVLGWWFQRSSPFSPEHFVSLLTANLFGAALVAVAWWGSSGADTVGLQLTWLNVALAGFGIASVANALWFAQGRRTVSQARRATFRPGGAPRSEELLPVGGSGVRTEYARGGLVAGPHMTRYHLSTCALAVGKDVRPGSSRDHELAGRTPCEICQP